MQISLGLAVLARDGISWRLGRRAKLTTRLPTGRAALWERVALVLWRAVAAAGIGRTSGMPRWR